MEPKPGYKTSEFAIAAVTIAVSVVMGYLGFSREDSAGVAAQVAGLVTSAVAAWAYIKSRERVKVEASVAQEFTSEQQANAQKKDN